MTSRHRLLVLLTSLAVPLLAQGHAATDAPDTILFHGRVFTGRASRPYVESLSIKGGRILAVGTDEETLSQAGPTTRRIDLAGHLVIPGINDSHVHFEADVIGTKLDFGDAPDPACAHVLDTIRQAVAKVPAGTLLSGVIGPKAFLDPACTPASLDRIGARGSDRPFNG